MILKASLIERIHQRSVVDPSTGCWNWQGYLQRGYALFSLNGRTVQVHRAIYTAVNGAIPNGLTIDHLCRNKGCVNPDHMEPVTVKVNVLRGNTITAKNAAKTHCFRGHPLSGDNLNLYRGLRVCRKCKTIYMREWRAKNKTIATNLDKSCENNTTREEK